MAKKTINPEKGIVKAEVLNVPEIIPAELKEQLQRIDHKKAQSYIGKFLPFLNKLGELEKDIESIPSEAPTKEDAKRARILRLLYRDNRTEADKEKKKQKEGILLEGKLIDGMNNVVDSASKMKEAHLLAIEEFIERKEAAEKEELYKIRKAELSKYCENPDMYPLREMDEEGYQMLLEGQQLLAEKKIAQAEKEKLKAERAALLLPYIETTPNLSLEELPEIAWQELLTNAKAAHEEKLAAAELERKQKEAELETLRKEKEEREVTERAEEAKKEKLFNERLEILQPYNAQARLIDLGGMSEADFNEALILSKGAFEAAQAEEQAQAAALEKKKQFRLDKVSAFGIELSGFEIESLLRYDDAGFDNYINVLQKRKEAEELEAVKKSRLELLAPFIKRANAIGINLKTEEIEKLSAEFFAERLAQAEKSIIEAEKQNGSDKERFADLLLEIEALKTKYSFKSKRYANIYVAMQNTLSKIIDFANEQTSK